MSENFYVNVLEKSSEDGSMTSKFVDVNCIMEIFQSKLKKKYRDELNKISELPQNVDKLKKDLFEVSEIVNDIEKKIKVLLDDYNTRKANIDTKYKNAVDEFCKLNQKILDYVPTFGRAKKLETLQMLVNYLYDPQKTIRETISSVVSSDENVMLILNSIDNFNNQHKNNLEVYLSNTDKKWEDCVFFPKDLKFDSLTMKFYNEEIKEGTPVYIISLGYDFPNSNSEKQLPIVFPSK